MEKAPGTGEPDLERREREPEDFGDLGVGVAMEILEREGQA
jgi:hypothetical protein